MATAEATKKAIKGGEFLIRETVASEIFTPEDFNEEQKMIRQQCEDFLAKEVWPKLDEIDSMKDPKLMPHILDKAGSLDCWEHRFRKSLADLEWISIHPCWLPKY